MPPKSKAAHPLPAKHPVGKAAHPRPAQQPETKINISGTDNAVAAGPRSFAASIKVFIQGNWKPTAVVLAVVAVLLGVILWYVVPRQAGKFTRQFGVAVAEFAVQDENGRVSRSQKGRDVSDTIASNLDVNFKANQLDKITTYEIWGPERTGLIQSEADARKFATSRNATIVVYGFIKQDNGDSKFSPKFFVNPDKFKDAAEITGQHELGSEVQVRLNAANPVLSSASLQARVDGLSMLTIGLVYYSVDQFDQAINYFHLADNPRWIGSGKDALYLLTGNAYIRQESKTQDFSSLPTAEYYYQNAAKQAKTSGIEYGRAMIGKANTQKNCDATGLDEASGWLDQAAALKDQPASANIETKVHFYRGQIALIRYDCKLPGGDWAPAAEQEFNWVVQRYEADPASDESRSIKGFASAAYAHLGWLAYYWHRDAQATINSLNKAIPLASPAEKADDYSLLGDVYGVLGQKDQARAAYQQALELAIDNGDQARVDHFKQKLASLSEP
jgi:tetratricopeptide (TPR) repeat protein